MQWQYGSDTPNDLREHGWVVACHNDYRQDGEPMTFWLFVKESYALKGEGKTDAEALDAIRRQAEHHVSTLPPIEKRTA